MSVVGPLDSPDFSDSFESPYEVRDLRQPPLACLPNRSPRRVHMPLPFLNFA